MLLSRMEVRNPQTSSRLLSFNLLHSQYRIFIEDCSGLVFDTHLFARSFGDLESNRSHLFIPLDGEIRLRAAGAEFQIRAGECMTERRTGLHFRYDAATALVIEWSPSLLGTRLVERESPRPIGARTMQRLVALAGQLRRCKAGTGALSRITASLLELLRAEGFPFDPVDAGTVHRRLLEFNERYSFQNDGGWRETLWKWRLFTGSVLMSVPGARTEQVASILGYASPKAFCYAFSRAGLPSPGSIRSALQQL